ncbi:MAG: hypothetical protein EBT68_03570, partial [Verrucomicrobia bacterium]|nr:hypothetical protein [Verrucomicrobiota bacterium]
MRLLRFPELTGRRLPHFFTLREEVSPQNRDLPERLKAVGFPLVMVSAEQVHGAGVARVGRADGGKVVPAADALISGESNLTLVVRVADCGP